MLIKRVLNRKTGETGFLIFKNNEWLLIKNHTENIVSLLEKLNNDNSFVPETTSFNVTEYTDIIPFMPAAYRDFMLYEKHAIDAARGFVKKFMPAVFPVVNAYEKLTGKVFPALKPKSLYYKVPIFYLGNHLNFFTDNDKIEIPPYTKELDYELEIAAIITQPLKNASEKEAEDAIGGFVILNDFSARNKQMEEMRSGFGPMKTKNFANSISSCVVTKNALLNRIENLNVSVFINEKEVCHNISKGKKYSFQQAIAYASLGEQLYPGELFGSGTIPGCTGIENGETLQKGDKITLKVEGIGQLTNYIF